MGICIQVQHCSKPTHGHAASLREVGTRSRTALRGPAHQLAVRMRIIISNNNYGMRMGYGKVGGTLPLENSLLQYTALHLLRRGFCTLVFFIIYTLIVAILMLSESPPLTVMA